MRLIIHKAHRGQSPLDVHGLYQWLFWDVSIAHDHDLMPELQRPDVWDMAGGFGSTENRMRAKCNRSAILRAFCDEFAQLKDDFFEMIKDDPFFKWRWTQHPSFDAGRISIMCDIMKDLPGHAMRPHLDNNHIIMQTVINLVDNPSSTDIYSFADNEPLYRSSKEQNRGVTFLNTPGAVHGITNKDHDRYILYSALMYQ